ncbi:MAG: GAF domain-containing protein [Chthonomonas sp.]|nr:GAF domain-containing protein [Chthonomonas sp.]
MKAEIQDIITRLRTSDLNGRDFRQQAMQELAGLHGYDWSGIYAMQDGALHLDAYVGAPTDHQVIAIGVGVCGTAVSENRNQVIQDVREIENYLACSLETRAEIVVLIRKGEVILGQIDIDSHSVGAFDASDEAGLENLAQLIAERWD